MNNTVIALNGGNFVIPSIYFNSFTPNNNALPYTYLLNTNCSATYNVPSATILLGTAVTPSYTDYFLTTFPGYTSSPINNINTCDPGHIGSYFNQNYPSLGIDFTALPAAALCLATTQLSLMANSTYQYTTITTDPGNYTIQGAFVPVPYLGNPPVCDWDGTTCHNYDSTYDSITQDVVFCQQRLAITDNLGQCITPPGVTMTVGGISYQPRCVYIKQASSPSGTCLPYMYDNSFLGGQTLGPYNLPMGQGVLNGAGQQQTIAQACSVPNTACYFEASPVSAIPGSHGTADWFANKPAIDTAGYSCNSYSGDSIGCPQNIQHNGVPQCAVQGSLCTPICSFFNNDTLGCANNLPYNSCFYNQATGICADATVNFIASTQCLTPNQYNCVSAQYICNAFWQNETQCAANSQCYWVNDVNFPVSSYCQAKNLNNNPQCLDSYGNVESVCNATTDQTIQSQIIAAVGGCKVGTNQYIQACVTQNGTNPNIPCVYAGFNSQVQNCFVAGDPAINTFASQYGTILTAVIITFAEWQAAEYPSARTYTNTFVNMPFRSFSGITVANMRNAGVILQPVDSPAQFYACANASYTAVGPLCCLRVDRLSGQCDMTTAYTNPNHPNYFMQQAYYDMCAAEVNAGAGDVLVMQTIPFNIDYLGIEALLPGDPEYTVMTNGCPTAFNSSFWTNEVGNYTIGGYVLGAAAITLQTNILQAGFSCSPTLNVSGTLVTMNRWDGAAITAIALAQALPLYNGTLFNTTFVTNVTGHLQNYPTIDFTWANVTTDLWSALWKMIRYDENYLISDMTARYGSSPNLWFARVPSGVLVTKQFLPLPSGWFSMLATVSEYNAVSPDTYVVYRVQAFTDFLDATVSVWDPAGFYPNHTYTASEFIIRYDDESVFPRQKQVFAYIDDGSTYIYSTPWSDGLECSDHDWFVGTTKNFQEKSINYTSLYSRCPDFKPSMMKWPVSAYSCFRDPTVPANVTDFHGLTVGPDYSLQSDVIKALGMQLLYKYNVTCPNGQSCFTNWNNTLTVMGSAAALQFTQQVQEAGIAAGCTEILNNFIVPTSVYLSPDNTTIYGVDFMTQIYTQWQTNLLTMNNATALANAINMYVNPLAASYTSNFCGNCGPKYGTLCDHAAVITVISSPVSCQNGWQLVATVADVAQVSPTLWQATTLPGTAEFIFTVQLENIVSLQETLVVGLCPSIPNNAVTPFSCVAPSGFDICTFSVSNPSTSLSMEVTFLVNSTNSLCNNQQTQTIGPSQTSGTQFNLLCSDATYNLYIVRSDGVICYEYLNLQSNSTIVQSITNNTLQNIQTYVTNVTDNLSAQITQLLEQNAVQQSSFTAYQVNVTYNFQNLLDTTGGAIANLYNTVQNTTSVLGTYINLIGFNVSTMQGVLFGFDTNLTQDANRYGAQSGIIAQIYSNIAGNENNTAQILINQQDQSQQITKLIDVTNGIIGNLTNQETALQEYFHSIVPQIQQAQSTTNLLLILAVVLSGVALGFALPAFGMSVHMEVLYRMFLDRMKGVRGKGASSGLLGSNTSDVSLNGTLDGASTGVSSSPPPYGSPNYAMAPSSVPSSVPSTIPSVPPSVVNGIANVAGRAGQFYGVPSSMTQNFVRSVFPASTTGSSIPAPPTFPGTSTGASGVPSQPSFVNNPWT
jgi:hypothetical protein